MSDTAHTAWAVEPILDWIVEEGRLMAGLPDLVDALGARLLQAGAPIWRLRLGMRTLHPLVAAESAVWERDSGPADRLLAAHGLESRAGYVGSPLALIARSDVPLRQRLDGELDDGVHSVLHEFKARGATDYFGLSRRFHGDAGALFVFISDRAGGFDDGDIAGMTRLARYLAPVLEVFRLQMLSEAVATSYLGTRSGRMVLDGRITRGDIDTVRAAILFSDIRGWTGLNARLPGREVVALANRYFEILAAAVEAENGEILKFLGDGVLAIFPARDDPAPACRQALRAAKDAFARAAAAEPPLALEFGIGMHVGEVLYGNVGSPTRLDFTVLGQAVNIAARIEALCRPLGRSILYSHGFAEALDRAGDCVAEELLKGLDEKTRIFAPDPASG